MSSPRAGVPLRPRAPGAGFGRRDTDAVEKMDRADCDPDKLRRTYARFPIVNRFVSAPGALYREFVRPHLSTTGPSTLLDIGCGGGEMALWMVRMAARDGFELLATGIDPDPRAHAYALSRARDVAPGAAVAYRRATSSDLAAAGERFDVVISNHVLHHLDDAALAGLLRDTEALARGVAVHADLRRSRTAYALFAVAAVPLAPGSFIRADGLTSIRRSHTAPELEAALPPGWSAEPRAPFRILAVYRPEPPADD